MSRWQMQELCGARAGGYNYALHEAAFPVDLTFPIAVIATFFVSLLVLLYVIHHRLQARRLPASVAENPDLSAHTMGREIS